MTNQDVVQKYIDKTNNDFFKKFIEKYPTKKDLDGSIFKECERDYCTDDESKGELTDKEIRENYWYPELEVYVIHRSCDVNVGEGEIGNVYCDFFNDLCDTEWGEKK